MSSSSAEVSESTSVPTLVPGSVDRIVTLSVPVCSPDDTVGQVRSRLLGGAYDSAEDVAVLDARQCGRRLAGMIPLERLLASPAPTLARDAMDPDPPVVVAGADIEHAAWKAVQHGESSIAVVDATGAFVGLVPPRRLVGFLLRAHDEDFARLGGYLSSTRMARLAAEEPIPRRLWHRLPWLVLGLAGAALSAWLVGLFEGRILADVRLAFFIPGVVYLADAVGTQTEALVVRGLSVGSPVRSSLRLEAVTGPALGLLLAAVSWPAIVAALGSPAVATAVAVSLAAACSVATVVAAGLPVLMDRFGRDPAFGSGPLATVIQDLASLVIYLAAAALLLG